MIYSKRQTPIKQFYEMYKGNKLNFELAIQRKDGIWNLRRQSLLIHSILSDYPVPPLFAVKAGRKKNFIDGKQRLTTVIDFIEDNFSLDVDIDNIDNSIISGKKFEELPEELKNRFYNYKFDLISIEDISGDEIEELFFRLNNGMTLKQIETTRAILGNKILSFVEDIAQTPFFLGKVNISNLSRTRYADQEMILQILALLHNENTGFSSKELFNVAKQLKSIDLRDDFKTNLQNICYYMDRAFPKKEKFLKKLHVPMLFKMAFDIQEKCLLVSPEQFGILAKTFYANPPEAYLNASIAGSARKENVQKRLELITKFFNEKQEIR